MSKKIVKTINDEPSIKKINKMIKELESDLSYAKNVRKNRIKMLKPLYDMRNEVRNEDGTLSSFGNDMLAIGEKFHKRSFIIELLDIKDIIPE